MHIAPVIFLGIQEGFRNLPDVALYNSTAAFAHIPARTTISPRTIALAGYKVPPEQIERENNAWQLYRARKQLREAIRA